MSKPKTRTLGAVLYEDFELLDLYGPLEMFGSIGAELRIVTVAEKTGPVASFQRPKTVAEFDFASAPMLMIRGHNRRMGRDLGGCAFL
jgi:putative intracellular protease/amidase